MKVSIKIDIDDEMIKAINHRFGETKQTKSSLESSLLTFLENELQVIYAEYQEDTQG
jgi:hypothetical protein